MPHKLLKNEQETTSTTDLCFCLFSALRNQLHRLLCICFCALKAINEVAPVVEIISCSLRNQNNSLKIAQQYEIVI